ncbi:uncharacterized protein TRIVIDRAFT_197242 [Trichoderma virens Gv29-8]|uniref:Uncharacterized protein n=1 Tax=Hypocrea virens (strain Gv29-8 / FGSC 10586) TaxID=413071 RepID=G9MEA4_HYPVG|nr:uncharacterized protein TRIVIDRAFT_197242 [Trichoderma virens Gv29-8]EHK27396.1 hypothetical protein TRIVIDRAFT_197242 [Trichoderma virens Gv29-8]
MHKRQRSQSDSGCIKDHESTGCGGFQFRIAGFGNLRILVPLPHDAVRPISSKAVIKFAEALLPAARLGTRAERKKKKKGNPQKNMEQKDLTALSADSYLPRLGALWKLRTTK